MSQPEQAPAFRRGEHVTATDSAVEIEQGLLGALLVDNRAIDRLDDLTPDDFHYPAHARIFQACQTLTAQGRPFTAATLKRFFANDDDLREAGGPSYLSDLVASVVTVLNVGEYGRQIREMSRRRRLIEAATQAVETARQGGVEARAADMIAELETKLYAIAESATEGHKTQAFSTSLTHAIQTAEAAYKGDPRGRGISTGLADVDAKMGDLKAPDLVILAGRPSMGKTALATNIALNTARSGKTVAFFSLEMSAEQIATRILAAESGVPGDLIRKGAVHEKQFHNFVRAAQPLADIPLYINDRPGQSVAQIRTEARRIKRQCGLGLIVVDYLQLVGAGKQRREQNRVQDLTEITAGLKGLAKEFGVPVLALSQLSRAVEQREDKRPQLSDLRESGSIEQDADIVAFVYREEYYLEREEPSQGPKESLDAYNTRYATWQQRKMNAAGRAELIIGKNRHGPIGIVHLAFTGSTTTFSNLGPTYDPARAM